MSQTPLEGREEQRGQAAERREYDPDGHVVGFRRQHLDMRAVGR